MTGHFQPLRAFFTFSPTQISVSIFWNWLKGAIISASLVELAVGLSGLVGIFLQLISPLAIAPVIALIGLSLFKAAVDMAGQNWTISGIGIHGYHQGLTISNLSWFVNPWKGVTIALVILFSQYLRNVDGKFEKLVEHLYSINYIWLKWTKNDRRFPTSFENDF